jgi:Domain of unknown function (DUF4340)
MKKSTLIVLVVAIALGAFVYFYDRKHAAGPPSDEASWKSPFNVKKDDITGLTLQNKSNPAPVVLDKQGVNWEISQPIQARADQSAVERIVDDLTDEKIERSFSPTDSLAKYGLAPPTETITFQEKGGAKHTLALGDREFSGTLVYVLVDGSKQLGLLPVSILDESNQPVSQLRDRAVLDLNGGEVTAFSLQNSSGEVSLAKDSSDKWRITKPQALGADSDSADALVNGLTTAKFTQVVSEKPDDLAKYGLAHPAITLDVTVKAGQQFHLLVGKKIDSDYYARDTARPMIFRIDSNLYTSLDKKLFDFRDKAILHFEPADYATVEIHNASGTIECTQQKDERWAIVEPAADKGKIIMNWKVFDPLQNARAAQIYEKPTAAILAHLAKPAIEVTLTDKSGKKTTISISAAVKDSVYARTSAGPTVYELGKQILTDLGFKVSDLLAG